MTYVKRQREITKSFDKILGRDWVRITNDAKNPLVIGLGGEDGTMSTNQKRQLGICACVGTMVEFSDPKGSGEARRAFVANLSLNTDKNSRATLDHLYRSLNQSPIKEILENPRHTKVEICFDHASNYISRNFLYGCTKTICQMYSHIRLIRWAPLAPCHGKTNLDRRFSNFTSWINTYQ